MPSKTIDPESCDVCGVELLPSEDVVCDTCAMDMYEQASVDDFLRGVG